MGKNKFFKNIYNFKFGCYSNNVLLGKVFLIYNCQSMINLIVGFIVSISVDEKKVLTIISNLLFSILKYAILYCGSKYLSLK